MDPEPARVADYERLARDLRHALWCCMQMMKRTGPEAVSAWENGQEMLIQAADMLDARARTAKRPPGPWRPNPCVPERRGGRMSEWRRLWHRLTCDGWERGGDGRLRLCRSAAHIDGGDNRG